ncbi:MAG TPA: hypothetical protein VGL27_05980, partial [Negativicutes bacterium]
VESYFIKRNDIAVVNTQTLEISLKDYHFHYSEVIGDSEKAWLQGINLSYKSQNPNTKEYWRVSHEQTNHNTDYDGATQSGIPVKTITNNKIKNTEVIFANPIADSEGSFAYLGYGYHSWDRNITGSGGYLEKYSWSYIPVGYRHEYKIDDQWDGAVDIEVKFMFKGQMKASGMGLIDPFRVRLGNKPGLKIAAPYSYKMNSQWSMLVTPWYEYSAIRQSNTVILTAGGVPIGAAAYEPNSNTHQYGLDIGISYTF